MNHVLPATGLRAVIVRLRATKPQKFGFLRHCEPLPPYGKRGIAPTYARRLPRPSAALYRGFPASAWTFMTIGSDVTVKNTPVSANFSTLGAMIHHPALHGLKRITWSEFAWIHLASRPRPPKGRSMARAEPQLAGSKPSGRA